MPTPTYDLIASNVLSSSASSVTFSSIPATYRDLIVVARYSANGASGVNAYIRFNGDTGQNYPNVFANGDGSTTSSGTSTTYTAIRTSVTDTDINQPAFYIAQVLDYSATDKHKPVLVRSNLVDKSRVTMFAARWANTSAITSLTIVDINGASWAVGSSFYLYGIVS